MNTNNLADLIARHRSAFMAQLAANHAIQKLGIDPDEVDPARILAAIAVDPASPATARVASCKALLDMRRQAAEPAPDTEINELKWLGGFDDL